MRFELHDNQTGEFIDAIEVDGDTEGSRIILGAWIMANVGKAEEPMIEVSD